MRSAENRAKFVEQWARNAEREASVAEVARGEMKEALLGARSELASARAKHTRYIKVALPAALEDAQA